MLVPRLQSPRGLEKGSCVRSINSAFSLSPRALVGAKDKTMCCRYNGADPVCSGHRLESTFKLLSPAQAGTGDCWNSRTVLSRHWYVQQSAWKNEEMWLRIDHTRLHWFFCAKTNGFWNNKGREVLVVFLWHFKACPIPTVASFLLNPWGA